MSKNVLTLKEKLFLFGKLIVKKYSLFFLIAINFFIFAGAYLGFLVWQQEDFGVKLIAEKTTQLSVLMLGIAFFWLLLDALILKMKLAENVSKDNNEEEPKKKQSDFAGALTRLLIGSFGASTIPTGISLVLCAFKGGKEYIGYLSGLEIYIAFAGITLMSIAVLSIYEEKSRMEDEIKRIENLDNLLHSAVKSSKSSD